MASAYRPNAYIDHLCFRFSLTFVKNRYRYSKHVNHRVFPAELPHYTPNTRDYAA